MNRQLNGRGNRGVTLIEAVSAIAVLSIAIPPLVGLFRGVASHSVSNTYQGAAIIYAESLLEEITSKSFEDPDESAGSFGTEEVSRASFDDVDDYDSLSNSPPTRLDGTLLDDYGGFTRSVTVDNVTAADPDPTTAETDGSTDYKRIKVTVTWSGGKSGEYSLKTLRTNLTGGGILDEAASIATVAVVTTKKFSLDLVSLSATDLEIESFDLTADSGSELSHGLKLEGKHIWHEHGGYAMPTGLTACNNGNASERTISAGASPSLEYESHTEPSGSIGYTLILYFTDASTATLTFTVAW